MLQGSHARDLLNITYLDSAMHDVCCGRYDPGHVPGSKYLPSPAVVHKLKSAGAMEYFHRVLAHGDVHTEEECVPAVWNRSFSSWEMRGKAWARGKAMKKLSEEKKRVKYWRRPANM